MVFRMRPLDDMQIVLRRENLPLMEWNTNSLKIALRVISMEEIKVFIRWCGNAKTQINQDSVSVFFLT